MTSPVADALAELRSLFADQVFVRLDTIRGHAREIGPACWDKARAAGLCRLVQGLVASADTFGMRAVADAAQALDTRLARLLAERSTPTAADWQVIDEALDHLDRMAQSQLASGVPRPVRANSGREDPAGPLLFLVEAGVRQADLLREVLSAKGYRVAVFNEVAAFRRACTAPDAERPAAVLMDMPPPGGQAVDAAMLAGLGLGKQAGIPVIAITARDDLPTRLAALRAGACRYFVKPVNTGGLIELLEALTGRLPETPYRVLLVDDDPGSLETAATALRQAGMTVRALPEPLGTLDTVDEFAPDVVVLDVRMPEASGPELAAVLRERDGHLQLPILFLSSDIDISRELLALNLGGDDFLFKPVPPERLVAAVRTRAWRSRQNHLHRQRLQSALYEREREHQALDHHAIVSIADKAGNITYVNDRFCQVSGYRREELLGQNHRIVKSGQHPAAFYEAMWRTIGHGEIWEGEICNRRKDGTLYWVESTITPFLGGDGRPYQYVSIRTDITHVKLAEAAVRKSEARLNFLVTSSPVTIYTSVATSPFSINYVSPNVRELTGYGPERFVADDRFRTDNIHPKDRQRVCDALTTLHEHGVHQLEYRFRTQDGRFRWIHDELRLVRDDAGAPVEIVGYWMDITERKLAEESAEAHKERLRRGQRYANIGTWDWNVQTGDLYWTERIPPLFGYAEGELETSYENFLAAIHPDDRQTVTDAVTACIEHDVPYEVEHRVVWPDGTVRWLLERGAVLRDEGGAPLQMVGVVQDIDDRKRAELALAEHERQLCEAQTLARIGNWQADMRTGELVWSDEIYRIFGHEPDSFAPSVEAFLAAVHPQDRDLVRESEKRAEHTGRHDVVHRIVRPDGAVRHVHELAQAETDAAGNLLRLTGTVQDITERVVAEARLRETEERFAFAVEGAGDGVWDWDMQTDAMQFSRLYAEMLGYAEGELPPHANSWAYSVHPDDVDDVRQRLADYLEGRVPVFAVELRMRCKNGDYKWILCRGTVVNRDADGRPRRMIGIHSDIAERKRNEQALIAAREEADRANRAKSEFLSSMSHELRTPMNAILGFGQLMEYDDSLAEDQKDNVREILKAGTHLLELINEVLDLAKIESGRIKLSLEPVDVCPIVEECLRLVGTLADKRSIRLGHTGLKRARVRADRTRLKQVLLNLLSNAIKYNRDGGSVTVDVRLADDGLLHLGVNDTGAGIAPERLDEMFQPFNRLDAEYTDIEGTGIGLTITRRIVDMMGGALKVTSEPGIGSHFWIELPVESPPQDVDEVAPAGSAADNDATDQTAPLPTRTVLYIEDNPANLKLVAQLVALRPHLHLVTAHDPQLGIELALAHRPELILLDINMPGMDGYQVLEVFKSQSWHKTTAIVAISANAMPADIEQGRMTGFHDYLTKPIDVSKFFTMLDSCMPNLGTAGA